MPNISTNATSMRNSFSFFPTRLGTLLNYVLRVALRGIDVLNLNKDTSWSL